MSSDTDRVIVTLRDLVQCSQDLVSWTTLPNMTVNAYDDGLWSDFGSAEFEQDWGAIAEEGANPVNLAEPDITGMYVRILRESEVGLGTESIQGITYDPVWHGKMLSPDALTNGAGGTTTYRAIGIGCILNECTCRYGRWVRDDGTSWGISYDLPPFNRTLVGDRSTGLFTIAGAPAIYIHDLRDNFSGVPWTARQVIDYLMACNFGHSQPPIKDQYGSGIAFVISDPDGCLDYVVPTTDAEGMTMAQVLDELAGKDRGMSWRASVVGPTLIITIRSTTAQAVSVGTSPNNWTVPANAATWDLDGDTPAVDPLRVRINADAQADVIEIRGGICRTGITIGIWGTGDDATPFAANASAQLTKGWTDEHEAASIVWYDNYAVSTNRPVLFENAWRRFTIKDGWDGGQYADGESETGLNNIISVDGTNGAAGYGINGWNADNDWKAGVFSWPSRALKADGNVPCGVGFIALNTGQEQPYIIVAEDIESDSWVDHSHDWMVLIEQSPPAIIIDDRNDGLDVKRILQGGRKILVTLGIEEPIPLRVSYVAPPDQWTGRVIVPRTKLIQRKDLGIDRVLAGAVRGVAADLSGDLVTVTDEIVSRNDLAKMNAALAHARAWYGSASVIVEATDRGAWDATAARAPGTILHDVDDGTTTRTADAVVTKRRVRKQIQDGCPYWSTTYITDAVYPAAGAWR